jgi:hypothetical protein
MAFKSEDDRKLVIDMIKAGKSMAEIIALDVCNQADVYNLRHILKTDGVVIKKGSKSIGDETPSRVKKVTKDLKNTKQDCPAWLDGLLREQERLREHLRRIDALAAMYDDKIPLNLHH